LCGKCTKVDRRADGVNGNLSRKSYAKVIAGIREATSLSLSYYRRILHGHEYFRKPALAQSAGRSEEFIIGLGYGESMIRTSPIAISLRLTESQLNQSLQLRASFLLLVIPRQSGGEEEWPKCLWKFILSEERGVPHTVPGWLKYPAVSRVSVSTPAYFRGFLRRFNSLPYAERIKPFGFLLSCTVSRFGNPHGAHPKAFHLLAPYCTDPKKWGSQLWTDAYSGAEFGVVTGRSYVPGIVSIRSIADIKAEFLAHGEVKSETTDGEPAGTRARGLLQRRHVSPAQIVLIGKESNRLDEIAAGLHGDWLEILRSVPVLWSDSESRRRCAPDCRARFARRRTRFGTRWRRLFSLL
jgi:hypothetical protein